jgi:glycosyltransferase involved in cell wall biosynthesis
MARLSILMPVFNEAATVERAINEVLDTELPVEPELVIVDDGSTDATADILRRRDWPEEVRIYRHERNGGKGMAVRTALSHATGEFSTIFDADLEYSPDSLNKILPPLLSGEFNAVFGIRAFTGHTSHSFLYVMGNRFVTLFANVLFNVYIADLMTCHKAIQTDLFRSLELRSRGFDIEAEITARLLQQGERIYEVPIGYKARSAAEGKKLTAMDGFRVLRTLMRCRLTPPRRAQVRTGANSRIPQASATPERIKHR